MSSCSRIILHRYKQGVTKVTNKSESNCSESTVESLPAPYLKLGYIYVLNLFSIVFKFL